MFVCTQYYFFPGERYVELFFLTWFEYQRSGFVCCYVGKLCILKLVVHVIVIRIEVNLRFFISIETIPAKGFPVTNSTMCCLVQLLVSIWEFCAQYVENVCVCVQCIFMRARWCIL